MHQPIIDTLNLGLIDYQKAHKIQIQINHEVKLNKRHPTIIICSHPSIVTLGKRIQLSKEDISWTGEIIQIERGGAATYHGPGQVVIYPIIPINKFKISIEKFLTVLENSMIETLKKYDVYAFGNNERGNPKYTGVWVEYRNTNRKIASIGIALKRWVSYHGLAINLFKDPLAFQGINPCGFNTDTMICLEDILEKKIDRKFFEQYLSKTIIRGFIS